LPRNVILAKLVLPIPAPSKGSFVRLRIAIRAALVAMFLGACAAVGAPAASAHPADVSVFCESGAARYYCQVTYSGAHDPVTITWYRNGQHIPAFDNLSFVQQSCVIGQWYTMRAVVTDVHGSAEGIGGFECRRVWQ